MNRNRLEAFSDGVLAITITIMVLELKVPHGVEAAALKSMEPWLAIAVFEAVALLWLVPDRRIEQALAKQDTPARKGAS